MPITKNIQFYSEGSLIKGLLYLPENIETKGKLPVIILCHGFAGVKELLLPNYAETFSQNDYIVLSFDYRGFGESEGERGKLSPQLQITDIRNAITYVQSLSEVNPELIGLWGSSFGGANAIVTAANDLRVKCLSVQLTFGDGERVITGNLPETEKTKLMDMIHKLWSRSVTQNKEMLVPISKVLTDPQSIEFFNKTVEKFPELNIKIPFLTVKETISHKPERFLSFIQVPILITGAENDSVNPVKESVMLFEKANEPKELLIIKGATHYEVYEGEKFNQAVTKQIGWFDKYLKGI